MSRAKSECDTKSTAYNATAHSVVAANNKAYDVAHDAAAHDVASDDENDIILHHQQCSMGCSTGCRCPELG